MRQIVRLCKLHFFSDLLFHCDLGFTSSMSLQFKYFCTSCSRFRSAFVKPLSYDYVKYLPLCVRRSTVHNTEKSQKVQFGEVILLFASKANINILKKFRIYRYLKLHYFSIFSALLLQYNTKSTMLICIAFH